MQLASSEPEDIKIDMTAMIDIVFQLLVFFVMTFKVVSNEGDFKIFMPLAARTTDNSVIEDPPDVITVKMKADENGELASVSARGQVFGSGDYQSAFSQLTDYIEKEVATDGDPENPKKVEVEFDIDYGLKYKHTVKGMEAVSGRYNPDDRSRKILVSSVKLKDNSNQGP